MKKIFFLFLVLFCYAKNYSQDLCADAVVVNCGDSVSGTTVGATSTGAPGAFCGTGSGAPGVWYTFTGTGDLVDLSLCGSTYDTKIQVYEGTCASLTCITGNDDSCGLQSEAGFLSTAGSTYYIYVFGYGTSTGNYTLDITCTPPPPPPANDACADALGVIVNPDDACTDVTAGTIAGATASGEATTCGGTSDDDVWFTFTATATTHRISLENVMGSTTDLYHVLYEGTDCATLTELYCSDPNNSTANALTVGNTYYLRVYSWTATPLQDTTFDVCITTPPPPITTDDTTYTVAELVEDVLIDSECAIINNITFSTGTGADNGIGYFTDGGSSFPFADGVILSSGRLTSAPGPNSSTSMDDIGTPGDADLEAAIADGETTENASIIEFDFVPVIPNISFNFLMASEEYDGTFACTFSDAFAFLLTDAGGTTTNLAVLPTTDTASDIVTVTNVHPEIEFGCAAANEIYFGGYEPAGSGSTNFNGRTIPLTAMATVVPGDTYHIKLVVADQRDTVWDTAVFIEGGSFALGGVSLGSDILIGSGLAHCVGDSQTIDAGVVPAGVDIAWYADGVLIPGETSTTLTVTETADYTIELTYTGTSCSVEDVVRIEFFPNPNPDLGVDIIKCANEANTLDANVDNATDPNMGPLSYVWKYNGAIIPGATSSTYTVGETTLVANSGTTSGTAQFVNPVDGSTTYISINPINNTYSLGDFTVEVTDTVTGCSGTSTMHIDYYENANCLEIPTGISPNGDGVNDCLVFDDLEAQEGISTMQIFNRYGTKVFENKEYEREWCGTDDDGNLLPVGTYYYILNYDDGRNPKRSWIYINREK